MTQHRWEVWLWQCVFALLPLILWLILARVAGIDPSTGPAEVARELLFFALAICTLVLSDLRDVDAQKRSHRGCESLRGGSIVVIAISAALYGVFLSLHAHPRSLGRLFPFAVVAALAGFVVGTLTQVFIYHGGKNARGY
jgi:uncharacterized membrane protein